MGCLRLMVMVGLAGFFLTGVTGCGKQTPSVPPPPLETLPPIQSEMPKAPVEADEGHPGLWEPLPGVTPPARAFRVEPTGTLKAPGILLVHSHWGVTRDVRRLARQFAASGFVVVVPDLLDGVEATSRLAIKDLKSGIKTSRAQETLLAGLALLKSLPRCQGQPLSLLASSAGGHWAMNLGNPENSFNAMAFDSTEFPEQDLTTLSAVRCPVLLLAGTENSSFPSNKTDKLAQTLTRAGVPFELSLVPMSGTDLLDSQAPGFSPAAREEAISQILAFFKKSSR